MKSDVDIERKFYRGPFGQVHVRIARPVSTTPSERPLFLLPPTPHSSDYFVPFMRYMATDRIVIAIDTPGYGDSARPEGLPEIADYAMSAVSVIETIMSELEAGSVDLMGYHTGGLISVEVAITLGDRVNRLALPGFPFFLAEARAEAAERSGTPDTLELDGAHLLRKWEYSKAPMDSGVSLERTQEHFADLMKSYPHTWRAYRAVFVYPSEERVPLVTQPVLLISVDGSLKDETMAALKVFPNASHQHLDGFKLGVFDLGPDVVANTVRGFL